ncbi:MAG: single-stranded DNA-binding protein [Saprospiraceae bacterium]|nr:single-stranded DNA-binding protein [Saprospiraceae bacterium]
MVNKVTLIGNLGKDPEVRHFENGGSVARITVATNESYRDKEGNWQNLTEWHTVVAWRNLADRAEKELKKGSLVYVEGKLKSRQYKDNNGVEKYITEIEASTLKSLEKRERTEHNSPSHPSQNFGNESSQPGQDFGNQTEAPDDLPF